MNYINGLGGTAIHVRFTQAEFEDIKKAADKEGVSPQQFIRRAVNRASGYEHPPRQKAKWTKRDHRPQNVKENRFD